MSAIITSKFYTNYTADFGFFSGAISKLKPTKVVTVDDGINFLRNRPISKPKNKLGETLQNLFKKKEAPKPYSLRSSALDDPTKRKLISTANKELKNNAEYAPKVMAFSPKQSQKLAPKTFATLSEARKNQVAKARGYIQSKKFARKLAEKNPLEIYPYLPHYQYA